MSADFQITDDTIIENSILKRDFAKIYHRQILQLNEADENVEFIFGENDNYQTGNSYLHFDIQLKKDGGIFEDDKTHVIRLVKNAFAHIFEDTYIHTTVSTEKKQ